MSEIQEVFRGTKIFMTGVTGFMGQVLMEKLLRTCHELDSIYIMVRPKKGKTDKERFDDLFKSALYDRLKMDQPDFKKKVHMIAGDCSAPHLGFSESDQEFILKNIDFIFHVAATVRFDEKLKVAFGINVLGTKQLLEYAKQMPQLKGFIHFSTAYSQCPREDIEEKFYDPVLKWYEVEELINSVDETTLDIITEVIIDKWPNTYSFTKCIAEDVINDYGKGLPLAVVRPSIVMPTCNEPIRCWINNVYGAAGVAAGAAMGLIRVMHANPDSVTDIIPVDLCINCCIASAWEVATTKPKEPLILNYVSSTQKPITYRKYMKDLSSARKHPAMKCIWYFLLILEKNNILFKLYSLFLHFIPGALVDTAAILTGKKPRLMRGYLKVHKFMEVISYFAIREWQFNNDNVQALWNKLKEADKKLFNFNIATLEWDVFLYHMLRGMRVYVFEEGFDTLPQARAKYARLGFLHHTIKYSIITLISWLVASRTLNYLVYVYNAL